MRAPWTETTGLGKQRDIAAALDATEGAVSQWLAAARRGGRDAVLSHMSHCGMPPKLTPEQRRLIPDFLWHGAEAYGFRGEVWTCDRVAGVIQEEFGVSYSKSQVSRLLKDLGWTRRSRSPGRSSATRRRSNAGGPDRGPL